MLHLCTFCQIFYHLWLNYLGHSRKPTLISMVTPLVQGTKDCINNLRATHREMFVKLTSVMENLVVHGFHELTEEHIGRFEHGFINLILQHYLNTCKVSRCGSSKSILVSLILVLWRSSLILFAKLKILTIIVMVLIDSDSTLCEYQFFLKICTVYTTCKSSVNTI